MIHLEDRGPVALLTIDRTERRNALDHEALEQLLEAHAAHRRGRACVVLTGAGGHFCAGADLTGVEDTGFTDLLRQVLGGPSRRPSPRARGRRRGRARRRHPARGRLRPPGGHARRPLRRSQRPGSASWSTTGRSSACRSSPAPAPPVRCCSAPRPTAARTPSASGSCSASATWRPPSGGPTRSRRWRPLTLAGSKLALNRLEMPVGRGDDPDVPRRWSRAWGERGPPGGHGRLPGAPPSRLPRPLIEAARRLRSSRGAAG